MKSSFLPLISFWAVFGGASSVCGQTVSASEKEQVKQKLFEASQSVQSQIGEVSSLTYGTQNSYITGSVRQNGSGSVSVLGAVTAVFRPVGILVFTACEQSERKHCAQYNYQHVFELFHVSSDTPYRLSFFRTISITIIIYIIIILYVRLYVNTVICSAETHIAKTPLSIAIH